MSDTETLKDDGIIEALSNHDKAISAEMAPTPNSAYINHERAEQEAAYGPESTRSVRNIKTLERTHGGGPNMCQF